MITGTTKTGFNFELPDNINDDWEFDKLLNKAIKDDRYTFDVAEKMLGEEQLARLEEHCRDENGTVRASAVTDNLAYMINAIPEVKNS